jgi:membrane associated rhomboid family serine protease
LQGVNDDDLDGSEELDLPVWARAKAFPEAGEGYGWLDRKGVRHACATFEELAKTIREDGSSAVNLVWIPGATSCRVPEEIAELAEPITEVRKRWAHDDLADAKHRLKWFGICVAVLLSYMAVQAWAAFSAREKASGIDFGISEQLKFIFASLRHSTTVGISLLGFLIFAFIPWYQAQKRVGEIRKFGGRKAPIIPLIRFETWLDAQKAPATWGLFGIISLVFIAQVIHDKSILGFGESIKNAGLLKPEYRSGEYWRLFTAPMLHGGLIHFVMNGLALLYLGKRLEVFARWPHVPMVFLFSAMVGGEFTARLMDAPSVGASGGLMGWLGFLLVFETLHGKLVPRSAKRRLIGGVVMTALIGVVGYRFIDNAAHFGGLFAGMAYAAIVFQKSSSVLRPRVNATDRIFGMGSLIVLVVSAIFTVAKIWG